MQGPNPFEGVPANGMRCAVRPAADPDATFAIRVAAMQQAHWNNGSGPGRPVCLDPERRPCIHAILVQVGKDTPLQQRPGRICCKALIGSQAFSH